ncbi:MAG TPA: LysR substrate-binding domain-containing protein [Stellaceae bacterium]|nr:LysR substrate-binding domain-containing protein [Stellaceae bacterium]
MALDLKTLSIFVKVGERLSFVRAAHELGMGQSGVSNAIARLEAQLGVRLVARTTRKVTLTEDGAALYERGRRILADLDEAERALTQSGHAPTGRLRLDLPIVFGRLKIIPHLGAFEERYPGLRLEVSLTDRYVDLVEEGIDVAVRVGALDDSTLVARRLTHSQLCVYGAPSYLARRGRPSGPDDLAAHVRLPYMVRDTRVARPWYFRRDGREVTIAPDAAMSFNDGSAIIAAACAGLGLVQMNDYTADAAVAAGELVPLLQEFNPAATPISLVYSPTRHLSPKVRVIADFLAARL